MAGKKLLDSTVIVAGGAEMVLGALMAAFPAYVPSWLAWICLAVGAATIVYGFYRIRQEVWEWLIERASAELRSGPVSATRSEWQREWHELKFRRNDFWSSAVRAYDYWNESYGHPPLHTLIGMAPFPSDLPLNSGAKFPEWVWGFGNPQLTGASAALNGFATAMYPAVKPARSANSLIFLGGHAEFLKFDDYRSELSKFCDHWGRQEPLEQVIREQRADDLVKNHSNEIKLLTYLEIARERWAQQGAPGKSGLFRLGRRNAETSG